MIFKIRGSVSLNKEPSEVLKILRSDLKERDGIIVEENDSEIRFKSKFNSTNVFSWSAVSGGHFSVREKRDGSALVYDFSLLRIPILTSFPVFFIWVLFWFSESAPFGGKLLLASSFIFFVIFCTASLIAGRLGIRNHMKKLFEQGRRR